MVLRPKRVAILTAGGLAPCLSAAVGGLIRRYTDVAPDVDILCYRDGYQGLLTGLSVPVTPAARAGADILLRFGGSPLGNSRIKLTNAADCVKRGLIAAGQDPQQVAAERLLRDGVDVLHTIGGDDTNTAAAELARFVATQGHRLTVIGLPKTVDNDVYPVKQSLGAWTAAEQGAVFFEHIVAEHSANPRMLIVHEVMGRGCGWLTAATAHAYRGRLANETFLPALGLTREAHDIHGVFIPEIDVDIAAEAARVRQVMDRLGCVNLFVSEGAGVNSIVREMESRGEPVPVDPFGHVRLDAINPGAWFGKQFAAMLGAEKTLVQKSGYFARSAPANAADLELIQQCTTLAVDCALAGRSGLIGQDETRDGALCVIDLDRVKGGKPMDLALPWLHQLFSEIGQPGLSLHRG